MPVSARRAHRRARRYGTVTLLALVASTALVASADAGRAPTIRKEAFGSAGNVAVDRYTLTNSGGMRVRILTYGGILQSMRRPA